MASAATTPSNAGPAPPKDLSHHLSRNAKARTASAIKQFYKYFTIPGIGQLAGGLPNDNYFPFDTLEAKVARPARFEPTPNDPVNPPPPSLANLSLHHTTTKAQSQDAILVPHKSSNPSPTHKIDLVTALQYGQAQGYPPLFDFLRTFAREHLHPNCPYKDGPEIILTCGNTDGFSKVLQLLTNEWNAEKDWLRDRPGMLVEKYCYMNALQGARPRGINAVPVEIDAEGMVIEGKGGLRDVLENWDFRKGRRPRLMYTVTMGQNPTSGVVSLRRRRDIYDLCCKYDIIICEDDPYWYLQYPSATNNASSDTPTFLSGEPIPAGWKSSGFPFLDSLVPSSISIDTEGRVIRLDTFSKYVAPGCRLGWITAQPALIERILRITETSTQQPSGFVQSLVGELLMGSGKKDEEKSSSSKKPSPSPSDPGWQYTGWVRWLEGLRGNYERRMTTMSTTLSSNRTLISQTPRHSPLYPSLDEDWAIVHSTPILSFTHPAGGMFLWLRINFPTHPLYPSYKHSLQLPRLSRALWILWTKKPHRVLVSPGQMFAPNQAIAESEGWAYFRVCFAACPEEEVEGLSERMAEGVRAFWELRKREDVEKLLEDEEEEEEDEEVLRESREGMGSLVGWC